MTPELKQQIKEARAEAKEQSDKWWDIICDDDNFDPYTDDDQCEVDSIVRMYDSIVDQLLQSKHK